MFYCLYKHSPSSSLDVIAEQYLIKPSLNSIYVSQLTESFLAIAMLGLQQISLLLRSACAHPRINFPPISWCRGPFSLIAPKEQMSFLAEKINIELVQTKKIPHRRKSLFSAHKEVKRGSKIHLENCASAFLQRRFKIVTLSLLYDYDVNLGRSRSSFPRPQTI